MKINLTYAAFDTIMKVTKPFVCKNNVRPVFTQLLLESTDKKVTVTALDGVKIVKFTVSVESGTESGKMLVPWVKPIGKKGVYACLTDDRENVTIQTALDQRTFRKVQGEYLDADRLFKTEKEPEATLYYDPRQLAEALSTFTTDKVKIDYFGANKGVIISDLVCDQKALVLPLRPPEKR